MNRAMDLTLTFDSRPLVVAFSVLFVCSTSELASYWTEDAVFHHLFRTIPSSSRLLSSLLFITHLYNFTLFQPKASTLTHSLTHSYTHNSHKPTITMGKVQSPQQSRGSTTETVMAKPATTEQWGGHTTCTVMSRPDVRGQVGGPITCIIM
jgi:hypothetical protein